MKKGLLYAATGLFLTSCANDAILDEAHAGYDTSKNVPISFITNQKNITRAETLQKTGHYNFGVWAYKNTSTDKAVMANYLVGYMDAANKKGYSMNTTNQTTLGDATSAANGTSMWAYEKMGNTQYSLESNASGEAYYLKNDTKYMSNNAEQWLKYWDYASANTEFFAYAPYVNGSLKPTFDNTTKKMTFPDNAVEAGYDDLSLYEFMFAYTKQAKSDYQKDVPLAFKRMNSKINIKFYEDIDGYKVDILDLKGNTSAAVNGVQATPATLSGTTYSTSSTFYEKGKAVIDFSGATPACEVTGTTSRTANLEFVIPTTAPIGTTSTAATPSPTTYYGLPLGTSNATGFTFHISYKLTALDTDEEIVVNNATVHVPASYVQWVANKHYTYVFKITKGSSGTTDPTEPNTDDYVDPTPDDTDALYPIVFDNCTVEDWTTQSSEHVVDGTSNGPTL